MKLLPLTTCVRLARRYREFRRGERGPVFVSWFLTRECPIRCAGCVFFSRHPTPPEDLPLADKLRILADLERIGVPFLFIAGGEPCVAPDLPEVLREARRRGLYTILVTSGLAMTPELARVIDGTVRGVIFSIDGIEPEHDRIRGEGNYQRAVEGMRRFLSVRRRSRVYVSCVIGRRNHVELTRFALDMRAMGVDRVNFQSNCIPQLKPDPGAVPSLMAELDRLSTEWADLFVTDRKYLEKLRTYFTRPTNLEFCGVPTLGHLALLPDGTVSACCEFHLPIGSAVREGLPTVVTRARTLAFEEVKRCKGCCRKDYDLVERFFETPAHRWSLGDLRTIESL